MNAEEAQIVARAVCDADGGCPVCVEAIVQSLARDLPEIDWATYVSDAGNRPDWHPRFVEAIAEDAERRAFDQEAPA